MDVDDSTRDEVSALMTKGKFLTDCIVLKVRSLEVSQDHPLREASGQLATAEKQYGKTLRGSCGCCGPAVHGLMVF